MAVWARPRRQISVLSERIEALRMKPTGTRWAPDNQMRGDHLVAAGAGRRVAARVVPSVIESLYAGGRDARDGEDRHDGGDDLAAAVLHGNVLRVPEVESTVIPALGGPVYGHVHPNPDGIAIWGAGSQAAARRS